MFVMGHVITETSEYFMQHLFLQKSTYYPREYKKQNFTVEVLLN